MEKKKLKIIMQEAALILEKLVASRSLHILQLLAFTQLHLSLKLLHDSIQDLLDVGSVFK